jgi:hypothetical protein
MSTRKPTARILQYALLLSTVVLASGCSNHEESSNDPASARAQMLLAPYAPAGSPDIVTADGAVGGMRTGYAARFEQEQLTRIVEIRGDAADEVNGDYTFRGARLLQYNGATLNGTGTIAVNFDINGVLQSATGAPVTAEDLASIRNRAQLLRSLALTRRSTQRHQPESR